jgi:hypothetical protein
LDFFSLEPGALGVGPNWTSTFDGVTLAALVVSFSAGVLVGFLDARFMTARISWSPTRPTELR